MPGFGGPEVSHWAKLSSAKPLELKRSAVQASIRDDFPTQVEQSVANLRAAGVRLSFQCVVTSLNQRDVSRVAEFADTAGAIVVVSSI